MSESVTTETFEVKCPFCETMHSYNLEVTSSVTMEMANSFDSTERPRKVTYTRLFTCPDNGKDFQARITISEMPYEHIKKVEVKKPDLNENE